MWGRDLLIFTQTSQIYGNLLTSCTCSACLPGLVASVVVSFDAQKNDLKRLVVEPNFFQCCGAISFTPPGRIKGSSYAAIPFQHKESRI